MDDTLQNFLVDTTKIFSEITVGYITLVDLELEFNFRRLMIYNTFDEDVVIKFTNTLTVELVIPAGATLTSTNFSMVLDEFWHDSVIEIKYVSSQPTVGFIKFVSWRGENK